MSVHGQSLAGGQTFYRIVNAYQHLQHSSLTRDICTSYDSSAARPWLWMVAGGPEGSAPSENKPRVA